MLKIIELIYPDKCIICGKVGSIICKYCIEVLKKYKINNNYYNQCNNEEYFYYRYEDIIREEFIEMKFKDKPYIAKAFASIVANDDRFKEFIKQYDIIIPVPMNIKKLRCRGYNQSYLLAREIASRLNKECIQDGMIKVRDTKKQSENSKEERKQMVKGLFKVNSKYEKLLYNKNVLIIDDIYTTGSTLHECKKELNKVCNRVGIMAITKEYI